MDYKKVIKEANRVLSDNFITQPPVPINEIVGNYELKLREAVFSQGFENVSGFIDLNNKTIIVNSNDSINRRVFTIAHELGHWLLHKELLQDDPARSIVYRIPLGKANSDPIEKEANCFAANLLVPDKLLEKYKGYENTGALPAIFGVSSEVMGYRLANTR